MKRVIFYHIGLECFVVSRRAKRLSNPIFKKHLDRERKGFVKCLEQMNKKNPLNLRTLNPDE